MRKIVVTGPESTGKTSLVSSLAKHYQVAAICDEFARIFIDELDRSYVQDDLLLIAKGQIDLEKKGRLSQPVLMICDTDLLTIKIWSEYKYGVCDSWILEQLQKSKPDIYFLCGIDVPWTYDPQREHPEERDCLFGIYEMELKELKVPYVVLNGGEEERLSRAVLWINKYLE